MIYFGLKAKEMSKRIMKPSRKYVWKLRLILVLIALGIILVGLIITVMIAIDGDGGTAISWMAVTILLNLLWWVPGMLLAELYYRSLSYEICDDEVIVNVGIINKTVKHVPYRTVTNITITRGPLDRWIFGVGTLKIQTAGMSGQTGAEEDLVGLEDVQAVYEQVVLELRKFRGGMAPTAVEEGMRITDISSNELNEILEEVRAIRGIVEDRA
jgi:membrane protein YdbS with pleckstrin-like domain